MALDKAGRIAALRAARGPLEHEQYALEIEVDVKKVGVKEKRIDQDDLEDAKQRLAGCSAQIKVIDDKLEKVEAEPDAEPEA